MVTLNEIMTEVNRVIAMEFSGVPIYLNSCPAGFQRPSFLIRCKAVSREDVNRSTIMVEADFTITCFTATNAFNQSDIQELVMRQSALMTRFSGGYIKVGDRAIKVKASSGTTDKDFSDEVQVNLGDRAFRLSDSSVANYDKAVINLKFEYFDDRTDQHDTPELMGSLETDMHL